MPKRPSIYDVVAFKIAQLEGNKRIRANGVIVSRPTSSGTWKSFERKVAEDFGTTRAPLSGMIKAITNSDTLHPHIYVECKLRGEDDFNFYDDFYINYSKAGKGLVPYYQIASNLTKTKIYLFTDEDFFKFIKSKEFDLTLLGCAKKTKVYKGVLTLYEETIFRANLEDKLPVIALKKKGRKGYLVGVLPEHLQALNELLKT